MTEDPTSFCDRTTQSCVSEQTLHDPKISSSAEVSGSLTLIYYTDPICSACWVIEPVLRKLKIELRDSLKVEYRMGGLLPGWEAFQDVSHGIRKPEDLRPHWEQIGQKSGMSIDGDIWIEDPLSSSFPPSIAFYAAKKQSPEKAERFLRCMRELLNLEKKNITRIENLKTAAATAGLNVEQFVQDYESQEAKNAFARDLEEGHELGVGGFPTFIFVNSKNEMVKVSGSYPYPVYLQIFEKLTGKPLPQLQKVTSVEALMNKHPYLSTREIAEVLERSDALVEQDLHELAKQGKLVQEKKKYSSFWRWI